MRRAKLAMPTCEAWPSRHLAGRRLAAALIVGHVESIEVHHLVPRGHEIRHELLLPVVARVDLRRARGARSSTRRRGRRGWRSICRRPSYGSSPSNVSAASDVGFHSVPMSSRFTKKSLVNVPGRLVNTPTFDCPAFAFSARSPPMSTVISGALSVSLNARSISRCSAGTCVSLSQEVAEPVRVRLEHGERFDVGLLLRRVRASRRERDLHVVSGVLRGLLDGGASAEHDQVGKRDLLLAAGLRVVELLLNSLQGLQHLRQLRRIVDRPILLRREANTCAVSAAALVGAAERRSGRPGGRHQLRHRQSRREDLALQRGDVLALISS